MKKDLFFLFVFLILIVSPMSLAIQLNVKTYPNHRISAFFREPGKLINIDSKHMDTLGGDLIITSELFDGDEMDLILTLKKDGEVVLNRNFEELSTDNPIYINFIPGLGKDEMLMDSFEKPEEVKTKETVENKTEEEVKTEEVQNVEEQKTNSVAVTGKGVEENEIIYNSKTIYYIIGAAVGILFLVFVVQTARRKINSSDNYRIVKYSNDDDKRIKDAERKLVEAKMELDEIKNRKKRLIEAKQRFEKDKDELKKLGVQDFY